MLIEAFVLLIALFAMWKLYLFFGSRQLTQVPYSHPRILMYHMIRTPIDGATFNKLRVHPEQFEAQIRWLAEDGWYFATMEEIARIIGGSGDSLPDKSVVITFDDGYEDNLMNADPILERHGARATLYLVSDRFDRDWSTSKKAHHDSGELMRERKLSDEQVHQMLKSGRWELGGHTVTHANLEAIDDEQRDIEIRQQRPKLVDQFDTVITSFAYPFGIYGPQDVQVVKSSGYQTAVTTVEGIPRDLAREALELRRVKVSGKDSLATFKRRLAIGRK
ncbi:MAG: polysaccharide deacetylase family protein [Pseudomonadota bacterium]